jgi:hypothetical protein
MVRLRLSHLFACAHRPGSGQATMTATSRRQKEAPLAETHPT